jgi:hypothetical protein
MSMFTVTTLVRGGRGKLVSRMANICILCICSVPFGIVTVGNFSKVYSLSAQVGGVKKFYKMYALTHTSLSIVTCL